MSEKRKQEFLDTGETTSIFRRGSTWYVNYQHDKQQIRRSLKTTNKKEAILRAQRLETDLRRGMTADNVAIASISDVIEEFLTAAEVEDRAKKTLSKYRFVCAQIQKLAIERQHQRIAQLDTRFADAYRAMLKKADKSPKTIYNSLVILRSLVLFARRRRMTDVDSLAGYKLRKPKPTSQPCWSPEQADAIVAAAPLTYRPYFLFLRETGCRAGEGKYLTWVDVDLQHKRIHIRPKPGWKPKTGDQRTVPMTEPIVKLLNHLPHHGPWVFTAPVVKQHPQDDRQISERRALQALKKVLKAQSLQGHLHTFRHTFISQALLGGVPEPVVRTWVGHVDPQIIRLYTHVSDDISQNYLSLFAKSGPTEDKPLIQPDEQNTKE